MKHQMICQRIYEKEQAQGLRVLVDRLWPRGIKKEDAKVDLWEKEIAPSNELRKFFSHIPERFPEFKERYLRELEEAPGKEKWIQTCRDAMKAQDLVLLYAAKDEERNNAVVMRDWLMEKLAGKA